MGQKETEAEIKEEKRKADAYQREQIAEEEMHAYKKDGFLKNLWLNRVFIMFVIPGVIWMIVFFYIPVLANVVAFKDFSYSPDGFIASLVQSPWVGFKNFEFLFKSNAAWLITRNTLAYNIVFIILNIFFAVTFAIIMSELRNKKLLKVYQTSMLFPYFLSWVIISYFVYAFLSTDKGLINSAIIGNGGKAINWYQEPKYWPFIIVFLNVWKGIGYNSILYFATVMGIDPTFYEAAMVDGANKWQQIKNVTIPQLVPIVTLMSILLVGGIFKTDFGLFYQVPRNSGALYNVTQTLDTYIYNGLIVTGDVGMSSAASLYQSVVGCLLLVATNMIVRKTDPDSALF